jgi:hypothetical protein
VYEAFTYWKEFYGTIELGLHHHTETPATRERERERERRERREKREERDATMCPYTTT